MQTHIAEFWRLLRAANKSLWKRGDSFIPQVVYKPM